VPSGEWSIRTARRRLLTEVRRLKRGQETEDFNRTFWMFVLGTT
jgi:hypothetical protein